ncbi:MAG: tetratricopeptide repeat protein [Steroidobacteraceae bacterium]|jgi:predicted O-linked N-acetylglucosamine transferase (SPINDLY family)
MNLTADDTGDILRQAYDLTRRGQFERAAALCAELVRQDAAHAQAWLLHAVIAIQTGKPGDAAIAARRSLQSDPAPARVHALLGDALSTLRQPLAALESYDAALSRDRDLISAHFGRGNALLALQRPREAIASFDRVLKNSPDDFEALVKRGNAQFECKDPRAAVDSYDRAVALRPTDAVALCNRGSALLLLQKTDAALESLNSALCIEPDFPEALLQRGLALCLKKAPHEALASYDQALRARRDYPETLVARGDVLRDLQRPAEALASFERALALRPDYAAAQRGIGNALLDLGRPAECLAAHDAAVRMGGELSESLHGRANALRALRRYAEAVSAYDESLQLDPRNAIVQCDRSFALLQWGDHQDEAITGYASGLMLDPDIPFVPGQLFHLQSSRADWSVRAPVAGRDRILAAVRAGAAVCAPFAFLSISDDAAAQLECARVFARTQCQIETPPRRERHFNHQKIRVAYVSADLREHAVTYLLTAALERHDRERFETFGVSLRPAESSPMGQRIQAAFDRFIDVSSMTDAATAEMLNGLEVDIAVDLTGYTQGFRPKIFALGAAPIQIGYLGYPGTMGASFMDYLIADDFVIPPDARRYYSEAVVYLPDCFQANDDARVISDRPVARADEGLPTEGFIFCCFNNSPKLNPRMFDLWMGLLAQVPGSVLWLLGHEATVAENLRREAGIRGIVPERLIFSARIPYADHLARLRLADLFLDTLPFNAGTTASDALWAGLPMLTCAGETFAARMAGSLLHTIGLPELIATDLEVYASRAIELARHPEVLKALRRRLIDNRRASPLFDTNRFVRHLESAYLEMWQRHARGENPSAFSVG